MLCRICRCAGRERKSGELGAVVGVNSKEMKGRSALTCVKHGHTCYSDLVIIVVVTGMLVVKTDGITHASIILGFIIRSTNRQQY